MAYRLIVTRPNGTQTHASVDPLATRQTVALSALKVLAAQDIAFGRAGLEFGKKIRDAEIGETLTHDSGYTFRTEEF